ncbi:MAG: shikimate kinase [Alphaproteobacteria bacterium]|nr:shikimate kinase [Alphaproteobacteria bacterium]
MANQDEMADHLITKMTQNIVLVGHMGSGKTNVGRLLAQKLDLNFVDSDKVIEDVAGISIVDIFELYGEDEFRKLELREISTLLDQRPFQIISVGGGAFVQPDCHNIIKAKGLSVWLQAAPETLVSRMSNFSSRPLLKDKDPLTVLKQLSKKRDPYFEKADLIVNTDRLELTDSTQKVMDSLDHYLKQQTGSPS